MNLNVIVEQVKTLPSDIDQEIFPASLREGFAPVKWLRDDWQEGSNRFAEPGEAFYTARSDGRLIGVCGVNRDPYAEVDSICRLRRLYVLPGVRRMGVGSLLVGYALREAHNHFATVRLRTLDNQSSTFFETLGFKRVEHWESATHVLEFDTSANLT